MTRTARKPRRDDAPRNRILEALPDDVRRRLEPDLEPFALQVRHVVYDNDVPIEHVYFPDIGVISILGLTADGTAIEVATVGNEGFVGVPVFLGAEKTVGQAFVQVAGTGSRMRAQRFREAVAAAPVLRDLAARYTQALFTLLSQNSACNRSHSIDERCARWILLTHDRVGAKDFVLTQAFLSQMLGVRRGTVSEVASGLQRDGLIRYKRGAMTIVHRRGLEAAACECYALIRGEFDRLLGPARVGSPVPSARAVLGDVSEDGRTTTGDGAGSGSRRRRR